MNKFNFLLQKRAYWLSLFLLIGVLFVGSVWIWGYQDVYEKRKSLTISSTAIHQQAGFYDTTASVNSSLLAAIKDVREIKVKLESQSEVRHSTDIIPYVVKVLDRISVKHSVELLSVRPLDPEVVFMLEERPFDITISGLYKNLFEWVRDAESELHPMTIKSFQLNPNGRGKGIKMAVQVVSHSIPGDLQ